jgi:hypothetical protein
MTAQWFGRSVTCAGILLIILGFPAIRPVAADSPRGVFALIGRSSSYPSPDLFSNPHISGLFFNRNWDAVEIQPGVFNWADYDQIIADAETHGKQVMLGVHQGLLGDGLPSWLAVPLFSCSDGSVGAIPWDQTFHASYKRVLRKLVKRYGRHPAVVGFFAQGHYNWKSDDFDLCQSTAEDRQAWIQLGYTRKLLQEASFDLYATVAKETDQFIRVPSAVGMINETTGQLDLQSTQDYYIDPFLAQYGNRGGIGRTVFDQNTGDVAQIWNTTPPTGQFALLYAYTPRIWGQRRPEGQGGPTDEQSYMEMADIALHYGVQFFEVGLSQVSSYPNAIRCLNTVLLAGGGHCGHD